MPDETMHDVPAQPAASKYPDRKRVELGDGRTAFMLTKLKGRHLELASRMAGHGASQMTAQMAMIAVITIIDGAPILLEDLREMDATDVALLLQAANGDTKAEGAEGKAESASPNGT